MEETLWKSADKLRGSVESSEYKHVVLSLSFLKFSSDTRKYWSRLRTSENTLARNVYYKTEERGKRQLE